MLNKINFKILLTLFFLLNIFPSFNVFALTNNDIIEEKIVYLTFDDGPSKNTEKILDILKENNVNATFFIISPYIDPHIKFIQRAHIEGNAIGNHTADHEFNKVYISEEAFWKSFNKQQNFINDVTGSECTIFRFPGGSKNTIVRNSRGSDFTKNLIVKLNAQGVNCYDWNVDSGDAKGNNLPAYKLVDNIRKDIKDKDGNLKNPAIVLMHDCMTKTSTVEALPEIIKFFKDEGYSFGTLN